MVGNVAALGEWNHLAAVPLTWGPDHVWAASVQLPVGELVEFKVVQANHALPDQCMWQGGENTIIDAPEMALCARDVLEIGLEWKGDARARIAPPATDADAAASRAESLDTGDRVEIITPGGAVISKYDDEFAIDASVGGGVDTAEGPVDTGKSGVDASEADAAAPSKQRGHIVPVDGERPGGDGRRGPFANARDSALPLSLLVDNIGCNC